MKKIFSNSFFLSCLSGIILSLAWPPMPFFFLLFIAFVPILLILRKGLTQKKSSAWFFVRMLPGTLIWNIGTTWWVWFASPGGAIAMLLANSLLMSVVLTAAYYTQKHLPKAGFMPFVFFWIGFEYFHFRWDVAYPWLTLGNGLSKFPIMIQWYEFTGVLGGTLWILIVNVLLLKLFTAEGPKKALPALVTLILPAFFSIILYVIPENLENKIEVVVVQPNLDPYNEKFQLEPEIIAQNIVKLSKPLLTDSTKFLILPETALPETFDLKYWHEEEKIEILQALESKFRELSILTGLETYEIYARLGGDCSPPTLTARKTGMECVFYDAYNTAGFFTKNAEPEFYHKAKLVPGVEKMPYPKYLGFLESLAIDLDGTSGSLGTSSEPIVFRNQDSIATCALICYESIFGDYVRQFVLKGSQFLCIITNDGWWRNTPGYKQHLYYGAVRAIENRRYIARSANTGISCFIDSKGNISQKTDWWVADAIKGNIKLSNKLTFYSRQGDLIGHLASFVSVFLFLGSFVKKRTGKHV
jgi:apolipoprotein N-acyltransferase